ncbi:hypothetical protein TW84_18225 [Vibrio neptunius]|uniref:hypothetical protein n=1 Tax=Vibrio neptunius TaxID=170651 RepID=UPI0005F9DA37|nr:hypothetical protein [Vibrio neptunius]KJY87153.1 hypothetical protein TW84_18225 [Vibrio neptunius]
MERRFIGLFTTKAQPFSKWWQEFRSEVTVVPMDDPFDPIVSVDDKLLTIRTGYHNRRNYYIVPWMLMLSILATHFTIDSWPNFSSLAEDAHQTIARIQEYRRTGYEPIYDMNKMETYQKAMLNGEGKVTFFTYMAAQSIIGELDYFIDSIVFLGFMWMITVSMWMLFFLKPRDAEIYFDRQRQIVYSWRHGRVGAAYFDKMGLIENHLGINLVLQFENKKQKGYRPMAIVGIDTGKLTFHDEADTTYPLAQILAFMDHGKSAVITGSSFKREPAKFFWRVDPKPDDLELRVNAALEAEGDLVHHYQTHRPKGHAI